MSSPNDFNAQAIEEFRANDGRVGGMFEGMPVLLLHHAGARSRERLFRTQAELQPQFAEYEQTTDRVIPVIVLTPR